MLFSIILSLGTNSVITLNSHSPQTFIHTSASFLYAVSDRLGQPDTHFRHFMWWMYNLLYHPPAGLCSQRCCIWASYKNLFSPPYFFFLSSFLPPPHLSLSPLLPLFLSSFCRRQALSVCHTRTWQAARVHLCKFRLKRSEIVPPHFLLIKISAHVAMIFLWGFSCCSTRPWKTRQGERKTFQLMCSHA